jgi:NADPH:quinone reductase-like Zn-dependent oxidoreductase
MGAFIDQHHLHPVIDKVFPLDQFDAALQHLRTRQSSRPRGLEAVSFTA